jgi:hypothetical protein
VVVRTLSPTFIDLDLICTMPAGKVTLTVGVGRIKVSIISETGLKFAVCHLRVLKYIIKQNWL